MAELSVAENISGAKLKETFPPDVLTYFICRFQRSSTNLINYAFQHSIGLITFCYGLLAFLAFVANVIFLKKVASSGLLKQTYLYKYLACLSVCYIIGSLTVMPFGVLVQVTYWNYGGFMCYITPVVQDCLTHLEYLLILSVAVERYREIVKRKMLSYQFALAFVIVLVVSLCLSLPDILFVKYYKGQFHGFWLEICVVDTEPMEEYARAMFMFLYAGPMLAVSFLFIQVSAELRVRNDDLDFWCMEQGSRPPACGRRAKAVMELNRHPSDDTEDWDSHADALGPPPPVKKTVSNTALPRSGQHSEGRNQILQREIEMDRDDVIEKRKAQKYLNIITAVTAVAWLPLNIISVVQFGLKDNHCARFDGHAHLYAILVWVAYLPALITPILSIGLLYHRVEFSKYFTIRWYRERMGSSMGELLITIGRSNTMTSTMEEETPRGQSCPGLYA